MTTETCPGSLYFYPELISAETIALVRRYCSNSVSFQSLSLVHAGAYWNAVRVKDSPKHPEQKERAVHG